MKNFTVKSLSYLSVAAMAVAGCKSLKLDKNAYTVAPNPLELVGDSVKIKIEGTIPEKTFHPKAIVTFTPSIKTANGEKALKPVTFVGTKVKDVKGTVVDWKTGGKLNYSEIVAYAPDMRDAKLVGKLDGKVKSKSKTHTAELAEATIVTPLLTMADEKPIMAKDKMPRTVAYNTAADILYTINSDVVRPAELKQEDIAGLEKFIEGGVKNEYAIKGVSVSSYASPDGIESKNADLAGNRTNSATKAVMALFKKAKMDAGTQENFYTKTSTPEDWEGFKELMSASNVADKDMILRILTTYSDVETREKEMKNISKAYTELADDIFPKLRRSKISINAEKACKTDDELKQISSSNADALEVEELLYAANLQTDLATKLAIYNKAAAKNANDWRAINNAGGILVMQNKVADAKAAFEKADKLSANNPVVKNNLGIIARLNGDKTAAEALYKQASGAGAEVNSNLANVQILTGDYAAAVGNYGSTKSFNAALANLLAGNKDQALSILDGSKDAYTAMGYYLRAVINARMGNATSALEALKNAISKDASLKESVKTDKEFVKFAKEVSAL